MYLCCFLFFFFQKHISCLSRFNKRINFIWNLSVFLFYILKIFFLRSETSCIDYIILIKIYSNKFWIAGNHISLIFSCIFIFLFIKIPHMIVISIDVLVCFSLFYIGWEYLIFYIIHTLLDIKYLCLIILLFLFEFAKTQHPL